MNVLCKCKLHDGLKLAKKPARDLEGWFCIHSTASWCEFEELVPFGHAVLCHHAEPPSVTPICYLPSS